MAQINENRLTRFGRARQESQMRSHQSEMHKPSFTIPLMLKKQNSIQKYIKIYKTNKKTNQSNYLDESEITHEKSREKTRLASNASQLLFGKVTPNIHLPEQKQCYVKYIPVQNEQTESRMEILDKMQHQYNRLKNNIEGKKDPYLRINTSMKNKYLRGKNRIMNIEEEKLLTHLPTDKIEKELKKTKIEENGKSYYADLYMLKKARQKMKNDVIHSHIKRNETLPNQLDEEIFVQEKMKKEINEKKSKLLKNKGLHWNVYYEILALTDVEKNNFKSGNSKFCQDYGVNN